MPPNDEVTIKQQAASTSKSLHNSMTSPTTQIIWTQVHHYLVVIVNIESGKVTIDNYKTGYSSSDDSSSLGGGGVSKKTWV